MAWRNIWRNPRRTLLTVSAIAFACMLLVFMLSFQFGSYETMINSSVKIHSGHLQVQARGYQDKQSMQLVVPDPEFIGAILTGIPEVDAYTYRAKAFSLVSSKDRTYGALVVGIDPALESTVSTLKSSIRRGSYLTENDANSGVGEALVGKLLARNLKVEPGDELTLLGQGRDGSIAATVVEVRGIYSSGLDDFDRSVIHIPLKHFQDIYFMQGAVHEVVAVGNSLKQVPEIKKETETGIKDMKNKVPLAVLDWEELMPGLRQAIEMDLVSGIIFYLILILVVAFSILNTFLMAIFERTREFGVLMAIGTTPGRLTKLLLIESLSMTMIGIVSGIILGCAITGYFQVHGIEIAGTSDLLSQYGISGRIRPKLSLLSATLGPALVLFITFLAALYPALKVRGLRPVEAMTHV
ncbi:MAG: ABC transporter permease [Deltaproteobacteria bacterium]|nr:ABC transporter permease [Deltaproteobacteria bacterium]